jgi:hypothetical protein
MDIGTKEINSFCGSLGQLWSFLSVLVLPSSTYLFTVDVEGFFVISFDHTEAHTTGGRTPLDEGSARRRDLYLTARTLYKTNIQAPDGIRTHDPSKHSAADLRLRPRDHWDPSVMKLVGQITEHCSLDMWMCPRARSRCLLFCAVSSCHLAVSILSSAVCPLHCHKHSDMII